MAILIHAHANVNFNRPYGAPQARVFLEQLLPETADIAVVLAHMAGAGDFDESAQQASAVYAEAIARRDPRVRNLYFDACIYATAAEAPLLARRIREIGVSRVLYGSDAPLKGNFPADALGRWHKTPLTAEEFHAIETNLAPFLQPVPARVLRWIRRRESDGRFPTRPDKLRMIPVNKAGLSDDRHKTNDRHTTCKEAPPASGLS